MDAPEIDCKYVQGTGPYSTCSRVTVQPDIYRRLFFEQTTAMYLGTSAQVTAVCCVKGPTHEWYDTLFIGTMGFIPCRFSCSQVEGVRLLLPDADPLISLLVSHHPKYTWQLLSGHDMQRVQLYLLGIEARLGPRNQLCVGIVFASSGQTTEEEMFTNCFNDKHRAILGSLGDEIELSEWPHFGKGFVSATSGARLSYYASYCGFEILFHVAPLLTQDERRQHIGNDKVLIYFLDDDVSAPLSFRGNVNSVAITCKKGSDGWNISMLLRERVCGPHPTFPELVPQEKLKHVLLPLVINCNHAVAVSPPYAAMRARAMQDLLKECLSGVPISSRLSSSEIQSRKRVPRNRSESLPWRVQLAEKDEKERQRK